MPVTQVLCDRQVASHHRFRDQRFLEAATALEFHAVFSELRLVCPHRFLLCVAQCRSPACQVKREFRQKRQVNAT